MWPRGDINRINLDYLGFYVNITIIFKEDDFCNMLL